MLGSGVGDEDRVVGLNNRTRELRGRVNAELQLGLFATGKEMSHYPTKETWRVSAARGSSISPPSLVWYVVVDVGWGGQGGDDRDGWAE